MAPRSLSTMDKDKQGRHDTTYTRWLSVWSWLVPGRCTVTVRLSGRAQRAWRTKGKNRKRLFDFWWFSLPLLRCTRLCPTRRSRCCRQVSCPPEPRPGPACVLSSHLFHARVVQGAHSFKSCTSHVRIHDGYQLIPTWAITDVIREVTWAQRRRKDGITVLSKSLHLFLHERV